MSVRKIMTLYMAVLIVSTTMVSIRLVDEVEAVPQNPSVNLNPLDMDYVWFQTERFADIIYKYEGEERPRGRAFGSWGGAMAADLLANEMNLNLSLENTDLELIKPINGKYHNKILNQTDFELQVHLTDVSLFFYRSEE